MAIFYDGFNDVATGCRWELEPNEHSRAQKFNKYVKKKAHYNGGYLYLRAVFWSGTKSLVGRIRGRIFPYKAVDETDKSLICDTSKERARKVATTLVNNWEIAHDIAKARNIKFFAILHPTAHIGEPKLDHLQEYLSTDRQKELAKQFKVVYPIIKDIIRERNHDWILDYTDSFSRNEYIYIGAVHVSANGNRIIAEKLYEDIKGNL